MATVNKDFKIKSGLIVEGTTATVNGYDILTKKQGDQDYIINLIGGTASSANTPDTVVKRDGSGNFAAENVTVNTLYVGGSTSNGIDVVNGDTEVGSNNGILLSATDDISLNSSNGDIVLSPDGSAYYGSKSSGNIIATRSYADGQASDALSSANTYTDGKISGEVADRNDAIGYAISTEVTNRNSAISTAKGEAISSANSYTDGEITDALASSSSDATTKANGAKTYADGLVSTEISNRNSAISSAISTEVTNRNSAIATAKSEAISSANSYADGKVADLVDSAPDLLNTLNELATAIADNPNYATDVANLVATKADTTYVDSEILDLNAVAQGYATTAENNAKNYADTVSGSAYSNSVNDANDYTDGQISSLNTTARGYATTAQGNAEDYADGLISTEVTNRNSAITTAIGTEVTNRNTAITTAIDALTTSDIEEGSNLYFTDGRAKSSAADLLTSANLTNITITGTGSGLTITAENGVADSTTSDLVEGSNLYFTAQRAVDALEAVVPNFTSVELNSVAIQVAATTSAPTAGIQVAHGFLKADWRSAEYLVKVAYGTHTEISKVLLTLDTSDNIAITEYGIVGTNGSASSISAGVSGDTVQLQVTTANNNSTVTVVGTLLA